MERGNNFLIIDRGNTDNKNTHQYNKVLYRLTFKSDRDLCLSGFQFLGLPDKATEESANFLVYIHIVESIVNPVPENKLKTLFPETEFMKRFWKGRLTTVELPRLVRIPAKVWIEVAFELDGPETKTLEQKAVEVMELLSEDGNIRLDVLRSPGQLKELLFLLA